jgi:hypothetical protein
VFVYELPAEFNTELKKNQPRCINDQYGTEIMIHENLLKVPAAPFPKCSPNFPQTFPKLSRNVTGTLPERYQNSPGTFSKLSWNVP